MHPTNGALRGDGGGGGGRPSESGLLVLDEFLSFVDEVGDVGDAPPPAAPFLASSCANLPIPEPVPLHGHPAPVGFDQREAEVLYHAMHTAAEEMDSPVSADDAASHHSWGSAGTTSAAGISSIKAEQPPPVKVKKKRRRRQKEELDYLRVRVSEMEEELTRLRGEEIASSAIAVGTARALHLLPPTTIDLLTSGDESDGDNGGGLAKKTKQLQLWERVAHRQKEETQKAVMENIRLRALLEGQLSVARSLETALRKKPRFASADLNPYIGKGSTIRLDGEDEQRIYDSIGLELDVLYSQVDAVLQSSGIGNVRKEAFFAAEVRADETGMFLEHKESRVVPFDLHAVGRAVWQTLGRESMPLRNGVYIARESTEDTVCAKVVDTFRLPTSKSETVVTIRLVLKRFVEEDRVVSVWESLVESVGSVCLRLREKAWNVLRPHSVPGVDGDDGAPKAMCLAHSVIRVWPEMAPNDSGENMEVGTLTNLVVGSYQRNLGVMAHIIQNLLSEEAKKHLHHGSGSGDSSSP